VRRLVDLQRRLAHPDLTKGAWTNHDPAPDDSRTIRIVGAQGGLNDITLFSVAFATKADAELVAHAPQDLRDLLAVIEALPRCVDCGIPATRRKGGWKCDAHAPEGADELHYAAALRVLTRG